MAYLIPCNVNPYHSKVGSSPIVKFSTPDLRPGRLGELFLQGAKVAILEGDPRVGQLWELLLGPKESGSEKTRVERMGWADSLLNMAWNHQSNNMVSGDMLWFTPERIGYIARKIIIFPSPDGQSLQTTPELFWSGDYRMRLPNRVSQLAWELMSDILRSTVLDKFEKGDYAVSLGLLKYPNSFAEFEKIWTLLTDSNHSDRWARMGQRLDSTKGKAAGVFDNNGLRDLFAFASLIPGLGALVHKLNRALDGNGEGTVPENFRIIGAPHTDGTKWITCLAS